MVLINDWSVNLEEVIKLLNELEMVLIVDEVDQIEDYIEIIESIKELVA